MPTKRRFSCTLSLQTVTCSCKMETEREKYLREGQQRVLDYLAQTPNKHTELSNEDFAIVAVSSKEREYFDGFKLLCEKLSIHGNLVAKMDLLQVATALGR